MNSDKSYEPINSDIHESKITRSIEKQTAKLPSVGYLGLAVSSMALSASLAFIFKRRELANFVGLWAPSILIMGLYNKLVKVEAEILEYAGSLSNSQHKVA